MKKKNLTAKLNLKKEVISNLNEVKGGDGLRPTDRSICICAQTDRSACICAYTDGCPPHTQGDECCTAGTSKIICC